MTDETNEPIKKRGRVTWRGVLPRGHPRYSQPCTIVIGGLQGLPANHRRPPKPEAEKEEAAPDQTPPHPPVDSERAERRIGADTRQVNPGRIFRASWRTRTVRQRVTLSMQTLSS